jgi:hypothetical protein
MNFLQKFVGQRGFPPLDSPRKAGPRPSASLLFKYNFKQTKIKLKVGFSIAGGGPKTSPRRLWESRKKSYVGVKHLCLDTKVIYSDKSPLTAIPEPGKMRYKIFLGREKKKAPEALQGRRRMLF